MKTLTLCCLSLMLLLAGCGAAHKSRSDPEIRQPTDFQLSMSNSPAPPPYQWSRVLKGSIEGQKINITYEHTDSHGKIKRSATLVGDNFEKCIALLDNTRMAGLRPGEGPTGPGVFDLTIVNGDGRKIEGVPLDRDEWLEFVEEMKKVTH